MAKSVERLPAFVDQHAQREQRRAADSVLAVDQHLSAAFDLLAGKAHTPIQRSDVRGLEVRRRQMQEADSMSAQRHFVIASFRAKIDHGANAMLDGKFALAIHRKASAEGKVIGQPLKVRRPRRLGTAHSFFIFLFAADFFFIFLVRYCCYS
jgi:hypothetical protein